MVLKISLALANTSARYTKPPMQLPVISVLTHNALNKPRISGSLELYSPPFQSIFSQRGLKNGMLLGRQEKDLDPLRLLELYFK